MSYKVKSICRISSLLTVVLLLLQPLSYAQYNFSELDKKLQEKKALFGGDMVALIMKGDSLIYKKEMGDFNTKTQAPIASCSKWLTAALVMIMVDEGKISLDDKVEKYLPVFESYGKSYITIRHCLSHMTGIQQDPIKLVKFFERKKFPSLEEEVNAFAAKEIQTNPGTEFRYGNIGLNIAGRILEVVTKRKFDALIKQKLFSPLGMSKTTFSNLDGAVNPSGGAKSTADDYIKFLQMLLNKGKFKDKQIISERSIEQMMTVQAPLDKIKYAPKVAEGFNYALGSWVMEGPLPTSPDRGGKATALASPGMFGTWPMIDYCRGYTCIFFVKKLLIEERADAYLEMKTIIDRQLKSTCR